MGRKELGRRMEGRKRMMGRKEGDDWRRKRKKEGERKRKKKNFQPGISLYFTFIFTTKKKFEKYLISPKDRYVNSSKHDFTQDLGFRRILNITTAFFFILLSF